MYDHKEIEKKWQAAWDKEQLYKTPVNPDPAKKKYILDMFPYPSGAGLHVGHPIGYIGTDILSRFFRMSGYDVLHPMGWDAFGLPAENYAIKTGVHPDTTTDQNTKRYKEQLQMIGLSYDWSREINTSKPEYYKWTQWLFLKLYEKGLAYKKEASVNWCPKDQTVLANEQVRDGKCDRCGTQVVQKLLSQWFFKITDYAEELLNDLEPLDWPEPIKLMQKNWIGKSEGSEIDFEISNDEKTNFVLLHGWHGSPEKYFFGKLKSELQRRGYKVQAPELPHPGDPVVATQVETALRQCTFDQNTVILGHSLGGVVAMKLIEQLQVPIRELVLVGSYIDNRFKDESEFEPETFDWKFDFDAIKRNARQVTILHDTNDPLVYDNQPEKIQSKIGGTIFRFAAQKGHMRADNEPFINNIVIPKIKVFTTRPDTLFGATYMVLAPEHPLVVQITTRDQRQEVESYIEAAKKKTELQRTALEKDKSGVFTGAYAINPATNEKIPVWIADYVLGSYGTGAIMAVPAHDERDFEFAKKYGLGIKEVVNPKPGAGLIEKVIEAFEGIRLFTGEGILVNSGEFTSLESWEARNVMAEKFGKTKVQYKLRDWLISRQRYWGAPIPIIYCDKCGQQAVPEKDLPVLLPTDVDFLPTGESPIARSKTFHQVKCPNCGGEAKRDSDTMDTFVDSSWYFFRFTDPHDEKQFASKEMTQKWLPVDTYVGGAEHAVLHLLYARFFTKVLRDLGYINFGEPFKQLKNQGLILAPDGEKMSKSKGNVINPDDIVAEYGADAFRMYEMFMGPFDDVKPWSTQGVIGVRRFLDRVAKLEASSVTDSNDLHKLIKKITHDIHDFKFNTSVAAFMEYLNNHKELSKHDLEVYLLLLAPFAPHLAEELWYNLGHNDSIHSQPWPQYDEKLAKDDTVEFVVQINGKKKGTIMIPAGLEGKDAKQHVDSSELFAKLGLADKKFEKVVFVKDKLVNFVIKE